MTRKTRFWIGALIVLLVAVLVGCDREPTYTYTPLCIHYGAAGTCDMWDAVAEVNP